MDPWTYLVQCIYSVLNAVDDNDLPTARAWLANAEALVDVGGQLHGHAQVHHAQSAIDRMRSAIDRGVVAAARERN